MDTIHILDQYNFYLHIYQFLIILVNTVTVLIVIGTVGYAVTIATNRTSLL